MILFINKKLVTGVALMLSLLVLTVAFMFTTLDRQQMVDLATAQTVQPAQQEAPEITDDVLWLARVIYSETKRPYEQELVAWVVRNRVETQYKGVSTYEEAVLAPWQFSAFNHNAPKRNHYVSLKEDSQAAGWEKAIAIAADVVNAPSYERPFARETRHFYSEISMVGRSHPDWAAGQRPVAVDREIDPRRFRFFSNIA